MEHSCVSVEQQALLSQQSATAKLGKEVREKSSVSEERTKDSWTKDENRKLWKCSLTKQSKPKKSYRK